MVLINQLDEHNEGNILATIRYNVNEVIFIMQKEQKDLIDFINVAIKQRMNLLEAE